MADSRSMSVVSGGTSVTSNEQEFEQDVDLLSDEQLHELVQHLSDANIFLSSENKLLEHYLKHVEEIKGPIILPGEKSGPYQKSSGTSSDSTASNQDLSVSEVSVHSSARKSRGRSMTFERRQILIIQHKCYIAEKILEEMQGELRKIQHLKDCSLNELKAWSQETDIQIKEIKNARQDFIQHIKIGSRHPVTKRIMGEKVKKYFEDSIKNKMTLTEKLRMQSLNDKCLRKRIILEIQEKEELSERLDDVDFQKIKIEHAQCSGSLKEYNKKYLQVKAKTNRSLQILTDFKKTLSKEIAEIENLEKQIAWQERLEEVIEAEKDIIHKEKEHLHLSAEKLLNDPRQNVLPKTMDYVHLKTEIEKKRKAVKKWKGKVEVAEVTLINRKRRGKSVIFDESPQENVT